MDKHRKLITKGLNIQKMKIVLCVVALDYKGYILYIRALNLVARYELNTFLDLPLEKSKVLSRST